MVKHRFVCGVFALGAMVVAASPAFAQPLGTFSWQYAPFCNVVTLYAVQQPNGVIALSGTDDQCGGSVTAAAVGTAHLNPSGSVGVTVVVTRPDGIAISSTADVSLVTGSGSWKDDVGNAGTFQISPTSPASGAPRRITIKGVYSSGFVGHATTDHDVSQLNFGRTLPTAPLVPLTNIIAFGASPTTDCPGSFDNPQAASGQLCLYERVNSNASYRVYSGSGVADVADVFGAHILTNPVALGTVAISGVWAVTIP